MTELQQTWWGDVRPGDVVVALGREWTVTIVAKEVTPKPGGAVIGVSMECDGQVEAGTPRAADPVKIHKRIDAGQISAETGHPVDSIAAEMVRRYFPEVFGTPIACEECGAIVAPTDDHARWHAVLQTRLRDLERRFEGGV